MFFQGALFNLVAEGEMVGAQQLLCTVEEESIVQGEGVVEIAVVGHTRWVAEDCFNPSIRERRLGRWRVTVRGVSCGDRCRCESNGRRGLDLQGDGDFKWSLDLLEKLTDSGWIGAVR